jgi:hypothetical protein
MVSNGKPNGYSGTGVVGVAVGVSVTAFKIQPKTCDVSVLVVHVMVTGDEAGWSLAPLKR